MTRIGFAYNQKPELSELTSNTESVARNSMPADGDAPRPEKEPPSISDEFAEWDSAETIDAVANALSSLGEVIRLEANEEFPELLRAERPEIVFNIAEGRHGVNRESHIPAICEFYCIPYSGSDPLTLSLCLDKAKTKETLAWHGVRTAR
ncbi:MAG: D-alanine--D-alanine ligase, partial [Gemmatimonadaceae bacterium]